MKTVKIGSRASALALAQTNWVKERLQEAHPGYDFEIIEITTKGDKILDKPLAKVGGKGLFIKEIEVALLEKRIDMAVHSLKDMPAELPRGLKLGAIPEREDYRDVLITQDDKTLDQLPKGAKLGTSSLRRKAELLSYRDDLEVIPIRGNINTRLAKMDSQNLDGIVLAAAGLHRMGWEDKVTQYLNPEDFVPAVGQGALAIEIREDDHLIEDLVNEIKHQETENAVLAERSYLKEIEGSCKIPVGGVANCRGDQLELTAFVASINGERIIKSNDSDKRDAGQELGVRLARAILNQGGDQILRELKRELNQ